MRMPIIDKYKDARGNTVIMGKIETGIIMAGGNAVVMPTKVAVDVMGIIADEKGTMLKKGRPGDNVRLIIKGTLLYHIFLTRCSGEVPENIMSGFVLCDAKKPILPVTTFEAQVVVMDLQPNKSVFCPGYQAVMHCHTAVEELVVTVTVLPFFLKT